MNYREEEIVRTEKISYRKDSMSAKTINSQIAYYKSKKTSVHMYSLYYLLAMQMHSVKCVGHVYATHGIFRLH